MASQRDPAPSGSGAQTAPQEDPKLVWWDRFNKPQGPAYALVSSFMGKIVRQQNNLPQDCADWRKVSESRKNDA